MSPTALSRVYAALAALCALAAALVGLAGFGVMTAQPDHRVTLRFEDVAQMPEGITPETVAAAAGEGIPSWRPVEMLVTGRHLTLAETAGRAQLPADVVLSVQDADVDFDSSRITSEFQQTAQVKKGAAARPGLFDDDAMVQHDTRWDTAYAYASNRDLGHGAHAVTAAAQTAGELTYDGLPREPLLYAGIAAALFTLGLIPLALWARVRGRIVRLQRRLRAARTDLARVILDLEAVEVAVLTTPGGAPGSTPGADLRAGLDDLTASAFALARGEEDLVRRMRRPDRRAQADLAEHEQAVDRVRAQAAALSEAAELRSRHAGAQTAADRLVAPLVLAAQPVIARARALTGTGVGTGAGVEAGAPASARPDVVAAVTGLEAATDALLQAAADAGSGDLEALAPRILQAEDQLSRAGLTLVRALRDEESARSFRRRAPAEPPLARAVDAVPLLRPDPDDAARRESAGLPAVGPADAPRMLAAAHTALLVASAGPKEAEAVADAVVAAAQDPELVRTEAAPTPEQWRVAVANAAQGRRRAGERTRAVEPSRPWRTLGTLLACVALAGLLTRPLAEAATAQPGWDLTGSDTVASLSVDGLPRGALTEEDLSPEGIRHFLKERLPEGLDVVVAVRPASGYLVVDRTQPPRSQSIQLDRPATLEGLHRLKGEFPELLEPGTGDLRPGAVIVPVFVEAGGTVTVDAALTGLVAYGTRNALDSGGYERTSIPRGGEARVADVTTAWEIEEVARGVQSEGEFDPDVSTDTLWGLLTASGAVMLLMLGLAGRAVGGALARRFGLGPARATVARARARLEPLMLDLDLARLDAVAVLGRGPAADAREAEQRLWESALVAAWREAEEIERLPLRQQWDEDVRRRADAVAARVQDLAAHRDDVAARADGAVRLGAA